MDHTPQQNAAADSTGPAAGRGDWRQPATESIKSVVKTIARAPRAANAPPGETLYSVPWYLVLGAQGGHAALDMLAQSAAVSIEDQRVLGMSWPWHWRFFGGAVGVSLSPEIVTATDQDQVWTGLLGELRSHRPLLPLNGIIACLEAESPAATIPQLALRLRGLIDSAMQSLKLALPVYVVVTGIERLPGYGDFVRVVPEANRRQVIGYRLPQSDDPAAHRAELAQLGTEFSRRSTHLLLSLIRDIDPASAQQIFRFFHHLHLTTGQVAALLAPLLAENRLQRQPQCRGVYFLPTGGNPTFAADLATRFLPVDQPLAVRA